MEDKVAKKAVKKLKVEVCKDLTDPTAKHLWKASNYIIEHGWIKGAIANEQGQVCSLGAIEKTSGGCDRSVCRHSRYHITQQALARYLGQGVANWNDKASRTKAQVVKKFREVAVKIQKGIAP